MISRYTSKLPSILVMEIYDKNLWQFFQEKSESTPPKSVSMSDAFELFWSIFRGLEHLHEKSLKHLDIKLSNVMINVNKKTKNFDRKNCVITDFGIGGQKDKETGLAGTPGFASPEQLLSPNVGRESDLYSLGRLMVFLFSEWKSAWTILYKPVEDISAVQLTIDDHILLVVFRQLLKVAQTKIKFLKTFR